MTINRSNQDDNLREYLQNFPQDTFQSKHNRVDRPMVSVIIPTLNEAKNLPLILPYLPMEWIDEVILVDGRSTDNTVEVARQLLPSIHVIMETQKGKGSAMKAGYKAATGDILIILDADGSNDPREIPRFVSALIEGADFVKGSRFAHGGGTTDMSGIRKAGNGAFVLMSNILFSVRFTDLCYGYHAFWRYCLDSIPLDNYDGFEIDTALYLQAVCARLRIVEVPSFEGYRFFGHGKLQTIPDGLRVLRTIMRVWFNELREKRKELYMGFRGIRYALPGAPKTFDQLSKDLSVESMLEFMYLFNLVLYLNEDRRVFMQHILQYVKTSVSASDASLILLNEHGDVLDGCLVREDGTQAKITAVTADVLQQGLAGWVIANHKPAIVENTSEDSRWLHREWDRVSRTAIALPLSAGGMVIGVLTLTRPVDQQFTSEETNLVQKFSSKGKPELHE